MTEDNYVPIEYLKEFKEYYDNQEGRRYPCSNQIVRCGVVTNNREKAIDFMKDKNVIRKIENQYFIEWTLDNNEKWIWRKWNEYAKGCRFYKIAIDKYINKDVFNCLIRPCCYNYCCSVEII